MTPRSRPRLVFVLMACAVCAVGAVVVAGMMLPSPGEEVWLEIRNESATSARISLSNRSESIDVGPGSSKSLVALRKNRREPLSYTLMIAVSSNGRELVRSQFAPDELLASPE